MYKLFCCQRRTPVAATEDEVTDSLEKCLSVEQGVREFRSFLERNRFDDEVRTLQFALKCHEILVEIARLSPCTRLTGLPIKIQSEITILYKMTGDINFDMTQMNDLRNLLCTDTDKRIHALELAEKWALEMLENIYKVFRRRA